MQAYFLGLMPGKPFTMDNYHSLQKASVCSEPAFQRMGITPRSIEAIVPGYLGKASSHARYDDYRSQARRKA
jgi:NADH dehydrogenase